MRRSKGISVIEVVIAICFLLVLSAISIPMLVSARESARETKCANNLRRLSVGALTYHAVYKRIPPGTLGHRNAIAEKDWLNTEHHENWVRTQHTSSLGLLMPFLKMQKDYEKISSNMFESRKYLDEFSGYKRDKTWFGSEKGVVSILKKKFDVFACPSDTFQASKLDTKIVCIQPVVVKKNQDDFAMKFSKEFDKRWPLKSKDIETTNYLACAGAFSGGIHPNPEFRTYSGMMTSRGRMTLESIRDGHSFTIMYGETLGKIENNKRASMQSWFLAGLARGRGDYPWDPTGEKQKSSLIGDLKNSSAVGFGSAHENLLFLRSEMLRSMR